MPLLAIPNVSDGRDRALLGRLLQVVRSQGVRVLDVHTDGVHHRSVFTLTGSGDNLVEGLAALAAGAQIDLRLHSGVHPRLGGLDVCPIVPHKRSMLEAIGVARTVGDAIGETCGLPVYLYGAASRGPSTRELPDLRRGGLPGLITRCERGLHPDYGPWSIDPARGVVCVGARGPLIAFNVWLECSGARAEQIASRTREAGGGPPGVRALGLAIRPGLSQVSMNLTEPERAGIDEVFQHLCEMAAHARVTIKSTEIVGLVEQAFLPQPDAKAARLLMAPGRSVEDALRSKDQITIDL